MPKEKWDERYYAGACDAAERESADLALMANIHERINLRLNQWRTLIGDYALVRRQRDKLAAALQFYVDRSRQDGESITGHYERLAEEFFRKTGMMAPGKSASMELEVSRDAAAERDAWEDFCRAPLTKARLAIAKLEAEDE